MLKLFGQMVRLPITVFVYTMEAFVKALRDIQNETDRAIDGMMSGVSQAMGSTAGSADAYASRAAKHSSYDASSHNAEITDQLFKEESKMADQDLRGDDLKLVRWTISFTKRDLEIALDQAVDLIDYSTSLGDYQGAKKCEWIDDKLKKGGGIPRPWKWEKEGYPDAEYIEVRNGDEYVIGLPSDDKDRFLRVFVEVLERYEKEESDYEKDEAQALKGIRNILDERLPKQP